MLEQAISLPFTILPNGSVATTTDQSKIWADRVLSVIGTQPGERVHQPSFGSKIHEQVFGSVDAAQSGVTQAVEQAFMLHLPMLTLGEVKFAYDESQSALVINVSYYLPNDEVNEITVGAVTIDGNSPIKEF